MFTEKLEEHVDDMQGIFINFNWERGSLKEQMEEFKKLKLSQSFIEHGIVFVIVEKEVIADVVKVFESQDFKYVENLVIAQISREKALETEKKNKEDNLGKRQGILNFFSRHSEKILVQDGGSLKEPNDTLDYETMDRRLPRLGHSADVSQYLQTQNSEYFGSSKKILLMFRRVNFT